MICKKCGNKGGFLAVVTDYKPLELWEFNEGSLTRYCQQDSGDMEMAVECAVCGSKSIEREGFDQEMYTDRPLVILQDDEWEKETAKYKKEEEAAEEEAEEEKAGEEKAEEENKQE
jgi:hypothetical protein